MRISTAYFAGVGTVIVAVAAGLGGGYLAANIANPPAQGVSKLERRMSAEPITVAAAPAEPVSACGCDEPDSRSAPAQPQTAASSRNREAAAPPANAASVHQQCPSRREAARLRREDRQQCGTAARTAAPAKPVKAAEQTRGKGRRASGSLREGPRRRHQTRGRRKAAGRTAPALGRRRRFQQPREQELEAVEERVREVTEPRRIRIRQEGEPGKCSRTGERRNAPHQAVRSGQLILFRAIAATCWERDDV